jgi:tRNA threonylcarbamoyladenosine biosynthesis protein TsaE
VVGEVDRRETASAAETEAVGAELAQELAPGDVVLIEGEIGTGKTTFVRGASRALGVTTTVTSPTFTIGQRYPGPVTVSHVDLYRINQISSEDPELLADYVGPDTITFVEWPQGALEALGEPARRLWRVRLEHGGGDRRRVEIR